MNHLEENAKNGLLDRPTQTELTAMALYCEAVSLPHIRAVRGPGLEKNNALDMGTLHAEPTNHICMIIANPELVLPKGADPKHATLNGHTQWDRPYAVNAIHALAPSLPHLRTIVLDFFEGVLETWSRFLAEIG